MQDQLLLQLSTKRKTFIGSVEISTEHINKYFPFKREVVNAINYARASGEKCDILVSYADNFCYMLENSEPDFENYKNVIEYCKELVEGFKTADETIVVTSKMLNKYDLRLNISIEKK